MPQEGLQAGTKKHPDFWISGKSYAPVFWMLSKELLKKNPGSKWKFLNATHGGRNRLHLLVRQLCIHNPGAAE